MRNIALLFLLIFPSTFTFAQVKSTCNEKTLIFSRVELNSSDKREIYIFKNNRKRHAEFYYVLLDSFLNISKRSLVLKEGKKYKICLNELLCYPLDDNMISIPSRGREVIILDDNNLGYWYTTNLIESVGRQKKK